VFILFLLVGKNKVARGKIFWCIFLNSVSGQKIYIHHLKSQWRRFFA